MKETIYDWSEAPDWANWMACDEKGIAYWYEIEPKIDLLFGVFDSSGKNWACAGYYDIGSLNWADSVEARPSKI